jgi:hypothetical protein
MTRLELLKILVGQARDNGFEFRRWYTSRLSLPWVNAETAFIHLEAHRRYYALLFSHEFARAFWKAGAPITFQVSEQAFDRRMPDGSIRTITRKPFMRRSARSDVWRYHLREMALSDEPLRYMRKYLHVEENLTAPSVIPPPAAESIPAPLEPALPPTLALARKSHDRRQLQREAEQAAAANPRANPKAKRGARIPGSRNS